MQRITYGCVCLTFFAMKALTVVVAHSPGPCFVKSLFSLAKSDLIEHLVVVGQEAARLKIPKCRVVAGGPLSSYETLSRVLAEAQTNYLLLLPGGQQVLIGPETLQRMIDAAGSAKAGMVYSDYYEEGEHSTLHPLCDYQPGSVRDDFDFGAAILFSGAAIRRALEKYGLIPAVRFAGLYDLRLKVSIDHLICHLQEPLYSVTGTTGPSASDKMFAYVDPRNEAAQKEMETVFTDYLKKIGAYLRPGHFKEVEETTKSFPVEASVIIPVRDRKETIAEAVESAVSQETDFSYNVIVVDNHSADGTTAVLSDLCRQYSRLKHVVPKRTDLGIGGCWNEGIQDPACGRYAVQLDSDDLYSDSHALQKMVDVLNLSGNGMVIGSYTLVNSRREQIPPGLVNHREWTDENGRNNALRINGLGAPRAFRTGLMRRIGFLNVSYGEDYAAALRISREYRVGRIYESLYLCRRWPRNTDAVLSIEQTNRNNFFKDKIRTDEILVRKRLNESTAEGP